MIRLLHPSPPSSVPSIGRPNSVCNTVVESSLHPLPRNVATKFKTNEQPLLTSKFCSCGRRHFIEAAASALLPTLCPSTASGSESKNYLDVMKKIHPPRPDWFEEAFASVMSTSMESYEAEVAVYKSQLFANLSGNAKKVLEIGIGTGPNLRYYAGNKDVQVFGVDPNKKMEKYARDAAVAAGLPVENFKFIQAVAEAIPLGDSSVDAIVGTLVLCSVEDVDRALEEVKRVLKPGGLYLFVEHVAAKDGTILKFLQSVLDPLQQTLADGCHLTRETGKDISAAGFSNVELSMVSLSNASFINPHVYGVGRRSTICFEKKDANYPWIEQSEEVVSRSEEVEDLAIIIGSKSEEVVSSIRYPEIGGVMPDRISSPWPRGSALDEIDLSRVPVWIQIHGVSMVFMSVHNAIRMTSKAIGKKSIDCVVTPDCAFEGDSGIEVDGLKLQEVDGESAINRVISDRIICLAAITSQFKGCWSKWEESASGLLEGNLKSTDFINQRISMCIQIHRVPIEIISMQNTSVMASMVGDLIAEDALEVNAGMCFPNAHIMIDITNSMAIVRMIHRMIRDCVVTLDCVFKDDVGNVSKLPLDVVGELINGGAEFCSYVVDCSEVFSIIDVSDEVVNGYGGWPSAATKES